MVLNFQEGNYTGTSAKSSVVLRRLFITVYDKPFTIAKNLKS